VSSKPPLESLLKTNAIIASIEKRLGDRGRVLIRYSGTEQKARIMVEGEDERLISKFVEDIHSVMLGEIILISKGFII
jgi:phosphoglucosamine mutase